MNISNGISRSLLLAVFCVAALISAQQKAIIQVMKNQEVAWNQGDLPGFMEGYWRSDSLQFIGSRGVTHGWDTTLHNYQKSYPTSEKMGRLTFSELRVKPLGRRFALVTGHWALARKEDAPGGIFTLIFQKFKNGWKIISDHTE